MGPSPLTQPYLHLLKNVSAARPPFIFNLHISSFLLQPQSFCLCFFFFPFISIPNIRLHWNRHLLIHQSFLVFFPHLYQFLTSDCIETGICSYIKLSSFPQKPNISSFLCSTCYEIVNFFFLSPIFWPSGFL